MEESKRLLIADALAAVVEKARCGGVPRRIGLMAFGNELGQEEVLKAARLAQTENPLLQVVAIGPRPSGYDDLEWLETPACESDVVAAVEKSLAEGMVEGLVAMHFPFPIGVATIGRILTPGRGNPMFIASCTGSASPHRAESLLRNAVYGIAAAKSCGIAEPTVAFLNGDGAGPALRALTRMRENGYPAAFAQSKRGDGGSLLRGNDIVSGAADVLVCDTLTGNALVKVFSTFTTGGQYESTGWGYGPSVGENWNAVVSIVSRASGAPVIANALALTAKAVAGNLAATLAQELKTARAAGLDREIDSLQPKTAPAATVAKPSAVPVDAEIPGVDVLDMENAAQTLWKENIYAESAMGCTGPVIRIPAPLKEKAADVLRKNGFI